MENTKITINTLIASMQDRVESGEMISPHEWLDTAAQMNVLMFVLDDDIALAEFSVAEYMAKLIESGSTVAAAKIKANSGENFLHLSRLKAKKERAEEFIRIAKKRVELARTQI